MNSGPSFHRANLLTYGSVLAAMGAVSLAAQGQPAAVAPLIAVAVIADTFDGKFARLFRRSETEQRFGAELDSLVDAVAFGAAPAACLVLLAPRGGAAAVLWWMAAVALVLCTVTRLAFFNVTHERSPGFVGLPSPVGALIWATTLLVDPSPAASAIVLLLAAGGMVAPIRIPRPEGAALAAFAAWPLSVIAVAAARLSALL